MKAKDAAGWTFFFVRSKLQTADADTPTETEPAFVAFELQNDEKSEEKGELIYESIAFFPSRLRLGVLYSVNLAHIVLLKAISVPQAHVRDVRELSDVSPGIPSQAAEEHVGSDGWLEAGAATTGFPPSGG